MDISKELLTEKRQILDEIFDEAKSAVSGLANDQYRQIMSKLMIKAVETGDEEVVVDVNETRIDDNLIEHVNQNLSDGKIGKLRLCSEREHIGGGFILKRGKIKNNASLDVLLSEARKAIEIELAKDLFGNDS